MLNFGEAIKRVSKKLVLEDYISVAYGHFLILTPDCYDQVP